MAARTECPLIGLEQVPLALGPVNAVAGPAGHRGARPRISCVLTQGVADAVLVAVTASAELHRIVYEEQRPITPVGLVTARALEATVCQMAPLLTRSRATGVVALGAQGLGLLPEESAPSPGVRVVAGDAPTSAGRDVRERGVPGGQHCILVAARAEPIDRLEGRERVGRAGSGMAGAAVARGKRGVHSFPEQAAPRRGVRLVALVAGGALDRIPLVLATERRVHLVAGGTQSGTVPVEKSGPVARVGRVAGGASPLGKGRVLILALLQARDPLVAAEAQTLTGLYEQTRVRAAMGLVAGRTTAFRHRRVNNRSIEPLDVLVAAGAQRPRPVAKQVLEPRDMGVVAGAALPGRHRGVLDPGPQIGTEIVAAETDLHLVQFVSGSGLGLGLRPPGEEDARQETDRRQVLPRAPHCAPPCASRPSW